MTCSKELKECNQGLGAEGCWSGKDADIGLQIHPMILQDFVKIVIMVPFQNHEIPARNLKHVGSQVSLLSSRPGVLDNT